jgi:hypothetical protein
VYCSEVVECKGGKGGDVRGREASATKQTLKAVKGLFKGLFQ